MSKAFSAPGKALLAGGYLVLEPIYDAYVTALSSRMHSIITHKPTTSETISKIKIKSPQFANGEWEYHITSNNEKPKDIKARTNPFLEATIFVVLSYVQPTEPFDLDLVIYSDPGYHSQENTQLKSSTNGKKEFLFHSRAINDVEKTGLGSSAGLVSVVTTSLLSYFIPGIESTNKDILHNVSQIAHCFAQKKIGSGFDVATAIYGLIIYKRFQPNLINDVFKILEENPDNFPNVLKSLIHSNWDFKHERCELPTKVKLLMGDIKGGSETPKLVSKILQWKKDKPEESGLVYDQLNNANVAFMKKINQLNSSSSDQEIQELVGYISDVRRGLQELTEKSQVPVEPLVQTELLDRIEKLPGCLGGVVPGAGGYDAIAVLVLEDQIDDFREKTFENPNYYHNVYWVDLEEETEGILAENSEDYIGL